MRGGEYMCGWELGCDESVCGGEGGRGGGSVDVWSGWSAMCQGKGFRRDGSPYKEENRGIRL